MEQLDFIPDEMYRAVLEDSFLELESAMNTGSWRSAVMLAGGIFESLLTMYLITRKNAGAYGRDADKLPIDKTMAACIKAGMRVAGTQEAKKLVLKYRKLIHPTTEIRLRTTILEADAREARMVVNSILEFISPTPVPWEESDSLDESLMELDLEDGQELEPPWEGTEVRFATQDPAGDSLENGDDDHLLLPNIRLARTAEPPSAGRTEVAGAHQAAPGEQADIRIPARQNAKAAAAPAPSPERPAAMPNIRPPSRASSNGAVSGQKPGGPPPQKNVKAPAMRFVESPAAAPLPIAVPEPIPEPAPLPEFKPAEAAANPQPAPEAAPGSAAPAAATPATAILATAMLAATPTAAETAAASAPKAAAGSGIDPRAAIRVIDTAISKNLRGAPLYELAATLEPASQIELLRALITKQALRIHAGKEIMTEVDKAAALMTLRDLYRHLLNAQPPAVIGEILNEHAAVLQGEQQTKGVVFIDYFFEAQDLEYLDAPVADALKKHIFQRMEKHQNRFFLDSILDIWFYLKKEEIDEFINVCLSCIIYGATHELRMETKGWLKRNAWGKMNDELLSNVLAPLQRWIENYEFFNDTSHANLVRELKAIAERR